MKYPGRHRAQSFDLRGIASDTPFKSYADFEVWRYTLPFPYAEIMVSHAQFDHICALLEDSVEAEFPGQRPEIPRDSDELRTLNVRIVPA